MDSLKAIFEGVSKLVNENSDLSQQPGDVREKPSRKKEPRRPEIVICGRQVREMVKDVLNVLVEQNSPPFLFMMNGLLVEFLVDEVSTPSCRPVCKESLERLISEYCDVVRQAKRPHTATTVPRQVITHILSDPNLPFPVLDYITYMPIVRPDGSICESPGYDPATRIYYAKRDSIAVVPLTPSKQQVDNAVSLLKDTIVDFTFESDSSAVNYLALLSTIVLRPVLQGNVPLFVITAPIAGSGKTLLACGAGIIYNGMTPSMRTMPPNDAELKKWLMSELVSQPGIVVLDNVKQKVASASLASVLTAGSFTDRILGTNMKKITCAIRTIIVMTGNNLTCDFDIGRRSVPICLDPKSSKPELRSDFNHPDFEKMIHQRRDDVIHAIFVLYRDWIAAGKPNGSEKAFGSFQEWADIVGGILDYAGFKGFLDNKNRFLEAADGDTQEWEDFLNYCYEIFKNDAFKVKDLIESISKDRYLEDRCPAELADILELSKGVAVKTGLLLKSKLGRRYGHQGIHLVQAGRNQYHIKVGSDEPECVDG